MLRNFSMNEFRGSAEAWEPCAQNRADWIKRTTVSSTDVTMPKNDYVVL